MSDLWIDAPRGRRLEEQATSIRGLSIQESRMNGPVEVETRTAW